MASDLRSAEQHAAWLQAVALRRNRLLAVRIDPKQAQEVERKMSDPSFSDPTAEEIEIWEAMIEQSKATLPPVEHVWLEEGEPEPEPSEAERHLGRVVREAAHGDAVRRCPQCRLATAGPARAASLGGSCAAHTAA
jgi:hypothetical protein